MTTVKLIRDKYQHIIPQEKWYIAPLSKLPELLANKLIEECQEMLAAQNKQQQSAEAGDVLEVLTTLQNYVKNNQNHPSWQNRCPTTGTDLLKTAKKIRQQIIAHQLTAQTWQQFNCQLQNYCHAHQLSWQNINEQQILKRQRYGGFQQRIVLHSK